MNKYGGTESMNIIQANLDRFRVAKPIKDAELDEAVNKALAKGRSLELMDLSKFFDCFNNWIQFGHSISGLGAFDQYCLTEGSAQSFLLWHFYNLDKRLRLLPGEYNYHKCLSRSDVVNYKVLQDVDDLVHGDYMVISVPFSDDGNRPSQLDEILDRCDRMDIPVMIDLAYLPLVDNYEINLKHKCIHQVVATLSKGLDLEYYRIGMRWSKHIKDDPIMMYNQLRCTNMFGAGLGFEIMKQFPPNYIRKKYRSQQIEWCRTLDITPSDNVMFGIDTKNHYPELNRGGTTNRVTLSRCYSG